MAAQETSAGQLSPGQLRLLVIGTAAVILSPAVVIAIAVLGVAAGDDLPVAAATEATQPIAAQAASALSPGEAAYVSCLACHGPQGHGVAALGGPALAGQEAWYLTRQLEAFRAGWRGTHPQDTYGAQMAPMAKALADDAAIAAVVEHLAALPPPTAVDPVVDGDPARGAAAYAVCATCHGPEAEGMEPFGAPRLTHQHGWYLERQIANYRAGIRGTHDDDAYGKMMAPMAATLPDEQAVKDVVAYIQSLTPGGE